MRYLVLSLVFASFFVVGVNAVEPDSLAQITYPVAELGNCRNKEDCQNYCDQPENMAPCLDFAEARNLIPQEELAMARKILAAGETGGPGNCRGQAQCQAYCDDINNMEECLVFAEKHDLIPPEELAEGKKVMAAIKRGIKPPVCRSKKECDVYCGRSENMEECLVFGEAAGLIPPEELGEAKKALAAVKKGAKLPACRGKADCDIYCSQDEHLEECLGFAEAAGFISPEEAVMARKTGGKGPGGCRGKEVCEAFCEDPANAEACVDFAVQYGFMEAQEAERAKKMMKMGIRGGPGNCKGKEECEAFCQNPENGQACLDFAVRAGDISPEEAEKAKQGMEMRQRGGLGGCKSEPECKAYCEDPSHGQECLDFAIQNGLIPPEEAQKMQEMMQRQMMKPEAPEGQIPQPPQGFEQGEMPFIPEGQIPEGMMPQGTTPPGAPSEQILPPPFMPPESSPSQPPQSFFEQTKDFLANTLFLLRK